MPEDFIPIARIEKVQLSAANGNNYHAEERIWTNEKTYKRMSEERKEISRLEMAEQMSIKDFFCG